MQIKVKKKNKNVHKKRSFLLKKKIKRYFWKKKLRLRLKKSGKRGSFFLIRKKGGATFNQKKYSRAITIKITSNNIFCTLRKLKNGVVSQTQLVCSAGTTKIRMSKKLLRRYSLDRVLAIFVSKARRLLNEGGIIFFITAPLKTRKRILRLINSNLRKYVVKTLGKKVVKTKGYRAVLLKFLAKKIFNGCQAKKKKRKKKKSFRLKR